MKSVIAALFVSISFAATAQAQNASNCSRLASLSDAFVVKFDEMKQTLDSNSYATFSSLMRPGDSHIVPEIESAKEALSDAMDEFINQHALLSDALRRCAR